jgi:molecular chaperone GrpE (heat shock protein)
VDRLETDLIVLERRKRAESRTAEETERIQRAQQELDQLREQLEQHHGIAHGAKRTGRFLKGIAEGRHRVGSFPSRAASG